MERSFCFKASFDRDGSVTATGGASLRVPESFADVAGICSFGPDEECCGPPKSGKSVEQPRMNVGVPISSNININNHQPYLLQKDRGRVALPALAWVMLLPSLKVGDALRFELLTKEPSVDAAVDANSGVAMLGVMAAAAAMLAALGKTSCCRL